MTSVASYAEPAPVGTTVLDVVIPVFNEERTLVQSVETVRDYLHTLPYESRVTIADNASTDATSLLAHQLAHRYPDVSVVSLTQKGRGRALKRAWSRSDAEVLVYMDVDLSTDLNALLPLVAPLLSGHSDLAIGSRLARSARTTRGPKRELISRTYNVMLRGALRARFSDAQCGFKAIRRDVAAHLLPLIEDDEWFFDTELLIVAERAGLRIHEVPVDWVDDPDSRVDIVRTAAADLRGMGRLGWALLRGRVPLVEVAGALGRTTARSAGGRLSAQMVVFALIGILVDARVRRPVRRPARPSRRAGGERHRPRGDRDRQHGGEPAVHVRVPRTGRGAAPSAARPPGVRLWAGRDERCPVGAASGSRRRASVGRGRAVDGREPLRDRDAIRPDAHLDLQGRTRRGGNRGLSGVRRRNRLSRPPRCTKIDERRRVSLTESDDPWLRNSPSSGASDS